jgi:uncharacterized protein YbjT (DUF2867 family)
MGKTAIVAGATGLIGIEIVKLLLNDPYYEKVVALVRKKIELEHPKLTQTVTNYEHEHLEQELKDDLDGADVFCSLGTTIKKAKSKEQFRKVDLEYPMMLGKLAESYKAAEFVIVTVIGANAESSIFYIKVKGQVEEGLKKLLLPALRIFHPSLLLGDRADARMGEKIGAAVSVIASPLMLGGLQKYKAIHVKTVAKAMLQAAKLGNKGVFTYQYEQIEELAQSKEATA